MLKKLILGLTAVLLAIGLMHNAKASLLGQTVACASDVFDCGPPSAVVVAGDAEFLLFGNLGPIFSINVEDSSYSITNISGIEQIDTNFSFSLTDLFWSEDPTAIIVGFNIMASGISGDSIIINPAPNAISTGMVDITWQPLAFFSLDIVPEHQTAVPEPSAFWLFSFGLALVYWWTGRARSVASGHRARDHTLIGRDRPSPNTAIALGGLGFMMRRHRRYAQEGMS